jgi:hypothetical protein
LGFNRTYAFQRSDRNEAFTLNITGGIKHRVGMLFVQEDGAKTSRLLAILSCR